MSLQSRRQQQRSYVKSLSLAYWGATAAVMAGGVVDGASAALDNNSTETSQTQTATTTTNSCQNNQYGPSKDNGCSTEKPICVTIDGFEPNIGQAGDHCSPCVSYTDHPGLPDWGCSVDEPLCVVTTTTTHDKYKPNQKEGTKCISYPCRNTKVVGQDDGIDDGCSQYQPFCVDGLGQDPPIGQPGMECVGPQYDEFDKEEEEGGGKTGWGLLSFNRRRRQHKPTFMARQQQQEKTTETKLGYRSMSLCTGCPLSGQGRTCEATKACDTLGGAITNW